MQARVVAQMEALLIAPLFERLLPESGPLGGIAAESFAREIAASLERGA